MTADEPVPAGPEPLDRPPGNDERQPDPSPLPSPLPPPGAPRARRGIAWPWLRALLVVPCTLLAMVAGAVAGPLLLPWLPADAPEAWMLPYAAAIPFLLAWWRFGTGDGLGALGHRGPASRVLAGLGAGTAAGAGLMALVVGAGLLLGAWTLEAPADAVPWARVARWSFVLLVAAYFEELMLRGVLLQEIARHHRGLAVALSSVAFAVIHVGNPNARDGGALPLVLLLANIVLAGLLLSAAFLHSGDLWLPTGLHVGWNWAQAVLFGLPVSGIDLPSVLDGRMAEGAPSWSGSAFGPESSLMAALLLATLAPAWLVLARRRGRRLPAEGGESVA